MNELIFNYSSYFIKIQGPKPTGAGAALWIY